ncbi:MAG: response regulator [Planctomycetota bacterium]
MIATATAPRQPDALSQFWTSESATRLSDSPRILIVEDDPDCQEGWSVWLRHQGFEVLSATDGAVGLATMEAEAPDVALLDLGLPGMHGLKVLHEMRMRGLRTPAVVITASPESRTYLRAKSMGAAAVLAKPVSLQRLASIIEELL